MRTGKEFARLEYSEIDDKVYLITKMFKDGWSSSTPLTESAWVDLKEVFEIFGDCDYSRLKEAVSEYYAD